MNLFKKKRILVTHDGTFHADDIFACATLSLYLKKKGESFKVIRTRNQEIINSADYVFDVGGIYDADKNRFDHHQKEGGGKRGSGVPYASFGLVWKHFGMEVCDGDMEVWDRIDSEIACPIDAVDNGVDVCTPKFAGIMPYTGERTLLMYAPTWNESISNRDSIFVEQVKKASVILAREIEVAKADSLGKKIILEAYNKSADKRIVELPNDFPRYLFQDTLSNIPEVLYAIYHSNYSDSWKVEAIHKKDSLESKKPFPESWCGFLNADPKLAEITGIKDILFSHKSRFYIVTKSKESAYLVANKALTT